jgi:hypothetical protein
VDNYADFQAELNEQAQAAANEGAEPELPPELAPLPPVHPALLALDVLARISKENADNAERQRIAMEYGEPF